MRPNCEALSAQFSPELGAVMTALMPAHFQIIPMGVNQRGAATLLAFRKALGADKAAYGLTAQGALTRDFPLRDALPEQCHHRLIMGHPPLAIVLDQTPMARDALVGGDSTNAFAPGSDFSAAMCAISASSR